MCSTTARSLQDPPEVLNMTAATIEAQVRLLQEVRHSHFAEIGTFKGQERLEGVEFCDFSMQVALLLTLQCFQSSLVERIDRVDLGERI